MAYGVHMESSSPSVVSDFLRKPLCFAPCGFSDFVPVIVAARHDGYTFPLALSFIEGHVQIMAAQPAKFGKVQWNHFLPSAKKWRCLVLVGKIQVRHQGRHLKVGIPILHHWRDSNQSNSGASVAAAIVDLTEDTTSQCYVPLFFCQRVFGQEEAVEDFSGPPLNESLWIQSNSLYASQNHFCNLGKGEWKILINLACNSDLITFLWKCHIILSARQLV